MDQSNGHRRRRPMFSRGLSKADDDDDPKQWNRKVGLIRSSYDGSFCNTLVQLIDFKRLKV